MTPLQAARQRPQVAAVLLAAAALAWWWTAERMAGMDAAPGADLGALGCFTGIWVVMMAAMMLPSFAPVLAAYATSAHARRPSGLLLFSCGYLLAWAAAGLVAYALFELGKGLLGSELAWHGGGRWLSAAVLALAAAYELTPLKQASLTRCREQRTDVPGVARQHRRSAALALGVRNGGWCIGCSWALMAALFALGVMSLAWMALIAGLVALEKTAPSPFAAKLATATVLAVLAAAVLAAPQRVPGLAVPGSGGMHTMKAMG
jgi:predicted metal-binding membrane protein